MRILVLSKRQYTGKDLLDDQYGRLYEIPSELAARGHEVVGLVLSYRQREEGCYLSRKVPGLESGKFEALTAFNDNAPRVNHTTVKWLTINALPWGAHQYLKQLRAITSQFRPDVVWACSDAFHGIAGALYSKSTGIPVVIDLYDNFESFGATRLPGITPAFRAACRSAAALTVTSNSLRDYLLSTYKIRAPINVVCNGIQQDLFYPRDRLMARKRLGLPINGQLIGTAGAISADRDIAMLFDSFLALADRNPSLHLAWAGIDDGTPNRYNHPRIIGLGVLPHEQVPDFFSALNVAVVCNQDTTFGRYCFPQKMYEILATNTPIVVAQLGDSERILSNYPGCLYKPGNVEDLVHKIRTQLSTPLKVRDTPIPTWLDLSYTVEKSLREAIYLNS